MFTRYHVIAFILFVIVVSIILAAVYSLTTGDEVEGTQHNLGEVVVEKAEEREREKAFRRLEVTHHHWKRVLQKPLEKL